MIHNKNLYIISCAIPIIEEKRQYPCAKNKNIRIGFSHASIISANQYSDRKVYTYEKYKYFLASDLRLYVRSEAADIAYHSGQIQSKIGFLFSDDFDIESYYDKFIKENPDKEELLKELRR